MFMALRVLGTTSSSKRMAVISPVSNFTVVPRHGPRFASLAICTSVFGKGFTQLGPRCASAAACVAVQVRGVPQLRMQCASTSTCTTVHVRGVPRSRPCMGQRWHERTQRSEVRTEANSHRRRRHRHLQLVAVQLIGPQFFFFIAGLQFVRFKKKKKKKKKIEKIRTIKWKRMRGENLLNTEKKNEKMRTIEWERMRGEKLWKWNTAGGVVA
ncbi:hypothetical protein LWI29_002919 [Acer saccharum]|uniref:Uncharacterized protein n=1 Tax=Acer saccharum TaxID=4024 RepID=A0AA39V658_ACESA|nr:hypothetical protein LWI29_002919 [Acer saccharum]